MPTPGTGTQAGSWQDLSPANSEVLGHYNNGGVPRIVITGNGIAYIVINNFNNQGYYLQPYNISTNTWLSAVHPPESLPINQDIYGLALGAAVSVAS